MNVWSCLLVFLVLLVVSAEGSKFKTNYPDYKSYQFQNGKSKANKVKDVSIEGKVVANPSLEEPCQQHQQLPQPKANPHEHFDSTPPPLPSQVTHLEYIGIIFFGAVLILIQIRKYNTSQIQKKANAVPKEENVAEPEKEVGDEEDKEGEGAELNVEDRADNVKTDEEIQSQEITPIKDALADDGNGKEAENASIESETANDSTKEAKIEEITEDQNENPEIKEKPKIELVDEGDEEEWIVVGQDGNVSNKTIVTPNYRTPEKGKSTEPIEAEEMPLVVRRSPEMQNLTTIFEKMDIRVGPETPIKEKLKYVAIMQKSADLAIKQRSLKLQEQRDARDEARNKGKELERQNSRQLEIYLQQTKDDEYHKMVILHVSVGIMVAIWLKVMDFSLFTLPFLAAPSSSSSYLPTSISLLYNLASWANTVRILYAIGFLVLIVFLWTFVSSLAPYVVLLFAFMHAWQSFFRAAIYFGVVFVFTTGAFYGFQKVRFMRRHKLLKLSIVYICSLGLAAMMGGIVAHGDPLNPYRIHFVTDIYAEQLISYLY